MLSGLAASPTPNRRRTNDLPLLYEDAGRCPGGNSVEPGTHAQAVYPQVNRLVNSPKALP